MQSIASTFLYNSQKTLDKGIILSYYDDTMQVIESTLSELFKYNPEILKVCQSLDWGKIEIAVKDGKPVMVTVKRDIKLS